VHDVFGCAVPIETGIWKFAGGGADPGDDGPWYRIDNYGVVHCMLDVAQALEANQFTNSRPSFLVKIGHVGRVELWALQIGSLPGSDYLLLARSPAPGIIKRFDVLQRACPRDRIRDRGSLDVLTTRYCSINSQVELIELAKAMAKLPPLGTLTFERESPADSDQ
jgi:hypothetical protein